MTGNYNKRNMKFQSCTTSAKYEKAANKEQQNEKHTTIHSQQQQHKEKP